MTGLQLLVVDDHPLFRDALRGMLQDAFDNAHLVEAGTFEELQQHLERLDAIDLILLDLNLPGVAALSGLIHLRSLRPEVPVVILSATTNRQLIQDAMLFGASGFVPKSASAEVMRSALKTILAGEIWLPGDIDIPAHDDENPAVRISQLTARLSPQQTRVFLLMARGLSNLDIANALSITEATAKAHVSSVLHKLEVSNRTQAVAIFSKWVVASDTADATTAGSPNTHH